MAVKLPEQIGGYIPLPVKVAEDGKKSPIYHIIYVKKHQGKGDQETADRSVFLVNLPTDTTIRALRNISQTLGNTLVQDFEPSGGNNGILIFVDKVACKSFLSKAKNQVKNPTLEWNNKDLTGSERYLSINQAKYKDVDELQDQVNTIMEDFARKEEMQLREVETFAQEVDEDGFIKVINTKRKSLNGLRSSAEQPPPRKKNKRSKEKTDFYRFQIRDQKKQEMNQLLRRFQQDKIKVAELKEKRRFRPY